MVNWNLWSGKERVAIWHSLAKFLGLVLTAALLTAIIRPKALPIRPGTRHLHHHLLPRSRRLILLGMPGPALAGSLSDSLSTSAGGEQQPVDDR
ncbi:MAG: hypothetical protein R3E31_05525 [Chloroflexota bacterium]